MILRNIILGENDDFLRGREACDMPFDKQKTVTHIIPEKFRDDVGSLKTYVGESNFKEGLRINVSLSEMLGIVPRKRRRVDAYDSLVTYLKDEYNILLTIKSKRSC